MTDNFREPSSAGRSITLELPDVETTQESLDRLRLEAEELRASRERLVAAADADRREIERALHDGAHQHLIALAVNLQLARQAAETDPPAVRALLDEMGRDLERALDETRALAQRIYPPLLEAGGLPPALRAAAAATGIPTQIEVEADARYRPEIAGTVYFCCIDALELAGKRARSTIAVWEEEGALLFEVFVKDAAPAPIASADRVEALGGRLTVESEPGRGVRISGSIPLRR